MAKSTTAAEWKTKCTTFTEIADYLMNTIDMSRDRVLKEKDDIAGHRAAYIEMLQRVCDEDEHSCKGEMELEKFMEEADALLAEGDQPFFDLSCTAHDMGQEMIKELEAEPMTVPEEENTMDFLRELMWMTEWTVTARKNIEAIKAQIAAEEKQAAEKKAAQEKAAIAKANEKKANKKTANKKRTMRKKAFEASAIGEVAKKEIGQKGIARAGIANEEKANEEKANEEKTDEQIINETVAKLRETSKALRKADSNEEGVTLEQFLANMHLARNHHSSG